MRDPLCMCMPKAVSTYAWHEGWQQVHGQGGNVSQVLLIQVYRPPIHGRYLQHLLTYA